MGNGVKVRMSSVGARSVLSDPRIQADLDARAWRIAARANGLAGGRWDDMDEDPYDARPAPGKRARAVVGTANLQGMTDNARGNTLLKALDAGR